MRPARITASEALAAATIGSQPITRSASAVPTLVEKIASGRLAIWMWLQVAPPFCARPAASCVTMPLPSRCAAMPSSWPMVMTPVPPTPATTMPQGRSATGSTGSGGVPTLDSFGRDEPPPFLPLFSLPPSTVTKLGQKPLRQE